MHFCGHIVHLLHICIYCYLKSVANVFSETQNYKSKYIYRNIRGDENSEEGEISDQFINMFKAFYNIYFSSALISKEYQSILNRAKILDEILINSKYKE
mgnify:CR=1 FL=1